MNIFDSINNLFRKSYPKVYSKNTLGDIQGIGSDLNIDIENTLNDIYGIGGLTCSSDVNGTGFLYFVNPANSDRIVLIEDIEISPSSNANIYLHKMDNMLPISIAFTNISNNITSKYKSLGYPISKAYTRQVPSPFGSPPDPIINVLNLNLGNDYSLNIKSPIILEVGQAILAYQLNASSGTNFTFNINFRERKK